MKIVTQQEVEERIKEKYPNQPFEIIEYTRISKPFIIKCLKCGESSRFSSTNNFLNRKTPGLCECYSKVSNKYVAELTRKEVLNLIDNHPFLQFQEFGYNYQLNKGTVTILCSHCGQIFTKPNIEFKKHPHCPYCEGKELLNTAAYAANLPTEYTLLGDYIDQNTKVTIRHSCGFIWKVLPRKLNNYHGCPKCNTKRSKGEQKIDRILTARGLDFYIEHSFPWQSNPKRRYDFYIPEYNLVIEYMGEQHYQETNYFKVPLEEQKEIDRIKKEECLQNNVNYLDISYLQFDNIETILNDWFNDYPQGVGSSESK